MNSTHSETDEADSHFDEAKSPASGRGVNLPRRALVASALVAVGGAGAAGFTTLSGFGEDGYVGDTLV